MLEQSRGSDIDRRKTRAVDHAETLFALASPRKWRTPAGIRVWVGNVQEQQTKFATRILHSSREEIIEAQRLLETRISGIRNGEVRLQVEGTVREVFASAAVNILRSRGQVEAAQRALQQRREPISPLSSTSQSSTVARRGRL